MSVAAGIRTTNIPLAGQTLSPTAPPRERPVWVCNKQIYIIADVRTAIIIWFFSRLDDFWAGKGFDRVSPDVTNDL